MLALLASRDGANAQGQPHASGGTMSEFGNSGHYSGEFTGDWYSGSDSSGSCNDCGEIGSYGCCDECDYGCDTDCGSSWWNCYGLCGGAERRWYFTADYLYVRASFSEAVAYIEEDITDIDDQRDFVHELDFQYESSYRFGGGYKLNCCDEEIRFMYTRLTSSADAVAPIGTSVNLVFVPYETFSPDSPTFITADVDVNSFDLDYRKTIPLGGSQCCECGDACGDCGDPCGCGDACCAPACPAWDITWSGGVRFAEVDWRRNFVAFDSSEEVFRSATPTLNFAGGGPRVGLEGRRYFGVKNWCSIFLKGDISVLLGQMEEQIHRTDETGLLTSLTARGRRIIPVTEIEAGASAQITCNSSLSAGYLFSAWHDLGFRDQFDIQTAVESNSTDTANILGFDGFFARLEVNY